MSDTKKLIHDLKHYSTSGTYCPDNESFDYIEGLISEMKAT